MDYYSGKNLFNVGVHSQSGRMAAILDVCYIVWKSLEEQSGVDRVTEGVWYTRLRLRHAT